MIEIIVIVNKIQKEGNISLIKFKDGSSFYLAPEDKFESAGKEFIYIESESIKTGNRTQAFYNVREIRSLVVKETKKKVTLNKAE